MFKSKLTPALANGMFDRSQYVISLITMDGTVYQGQAVFYELQDAMFEIMEIAQDDVFGTDRMWDIEEWVITGYIR